MTPRPVRSVVEVARRHRGEEARDDAPLPQVRIAPPVAERQHEREDGEDEQQEDQPRAGRLAGGRGALLHERLAAVARQEVPEAGQQEPDEQRRERGAEAGEERVRGEEAQRPPGLREELEMVEHGRTVGKTAEVYHTGARLPTSKRRASGAVRAADARGLPAGRRVW